MVPFHIPIQQLETPVCKHLHNGTIASSFGHLFICSLCWQFKLHWCLWLSIYQQHCWFAIPYSGKLSREKTFTNFVVLWLFAKVFSMKFWVWHPLARRKRAFRESFLCKNCIVYQSKQVFSLESFPLYGSVQTAVYTVVLLIGHRSHCEPSVPSCIEPPRRCMDKTKILQKYLRNCPHLTLDSD